MRRIVMPHSVESSSRFIRVAVSVIFLGMTVSSCGINTIPTLEEHAKAKWSDVQNQYQRRADLVPNLVETVKGYAAQEREVLTQVVEARARASQVRSMRRPSPIRQNSRSIRMLRMRSPAHSGVCWLQSNAILI
jgi:hypothetical protein